MSDASAETAAELLTRSPEEGARRLALGYLDQAAAALPRLADDQDGEALHDVRVALRRLRSCLRSYAPQLGDSITPKLSRRLDRLAKSTGPGRDVEVQIAWLEQHGARLTRHHRAGLVWLLARLGERRDTAYGTLRETLPDTFTRFAAKLRQHLSVYRAEVRLDAGRPPSFAAAAAAALRRHAADLDHRLARVDDAGDVEAAHRARISAKRLRYLADPLAPLPAAAPAHAGKRSRPPLEQHLKTLQDVLGELHDAHVLEDELIAALAEAAAVRSRQLLDATLAGGAADAARLRQARRRPQESGILALARLNRERRDHLFAAFAAHRKATAKTLAGDVDELAAALLQAAGDTPAPTPAAADPPPH